MARFSLSLPLPSGSNFVFFSFEFTANEAAPFDLFDPRRDKRERLQARGKHAHTDGVATCTLMTRVRQTCTHRLCRYMHACDTCWANTQTPTPSLRAQVALTREYRRRHYIHARDMSGANMHTPPLHARSLPAQVHALNKQPHRRSCYS